MIVDDFRNVIGADTAPAELLYENIIRNKATLPWSDVWNNLNANWAAHGYFIDKVMFHYTPMISAFIDRGSIDGVRRCLKFDPGLFDAFHTFFTDAVWVYIDRHDVFAQAVSMYLAESTEVWFRPVHRPPGGTPAEVDYDYDRLREYLSGFLAEKEQWQLFFRHYNIQPIRFSYEDAAAEYPHYLSALVERTGLRMVNTPPPRRLAKVGDERNEKFARFLRDDVVAQLYSRMHAGS